MGRKASGRNYQGAGGFYRQDDRSGFTVRAYKTQEEWTGVIVDEKIWEARQPQDLVRGVRDDQTVSDARSLPAPVYGGPKYTALNANVAIGATFIPLGSTTGLTAGDRVGIMTNLGTWFNTTVNGAPTATGVNITNAMRTAASSGNLLIDYNG